MTRPNAQRTTTSNVVHFYNNRPTRNCYKYTGGASLPYDDDPRRVERPTTPTVPPSDDDLDDAMLHGLTVAQINELSRSLPPLDVSREDALSVPDEESWVEFTERFQHISDDADAMHDDLLPALERHALAMEPSAEKDAVLRMTTSYRAKLADFFEVLSDIEADIGMLEEMMAHGMVDVERVEACIEDEPPPDDAGNWDAYVDLATRLRDPTFTSEQKHRIIADARIIHGELMPIGLQKLLAAHHRSFLKWEANIDAWNSVLEEKQHYFDRDARYQQARLQENYQGTHEQYERGLRIHDAAIRRKMDDLRADRVELDRQYHRALATLPSHDPLHVDALKAAIDDNKSRLNVLSASLSPVSLLEHIPLDDGAQLRDVTSDYRAKIPTRGVGQGAWTSHHSKPKKKARPFTEVVVHTTPTKLVRTPVVKSTKPMCECKGRKTKGECENTPGCRWAMGIGCRKDPTGVVAPSTCLGQSNSRFDGL